jgi:repressor LexA
MYDINDLSGKQRKIFLYIKDYIDEKGYPPTVRDICEAVDLKSTSTVHGHLQRLEKKGLIRRDESKPRAIEVLDFESEAKSKVMSIPLVGRVTAGQPILAVENIEEHIPLPQSFVRDENSYVLQVSGDSMINAGIYDNDFIVVRKQNYADDGDIVVAMVYDTEGEATVKRFYQEGKKIRLQPENDTMDPFVFPVNEVEILGKVTGLYRRIR